MLAPGGPGNNYKTVEGRNGYPDDSLRPATPKNKRRNYTQHSLHARQASLWVSLTQAVGWSFHSPGPRDPVSRCTASEYRAHAPLTSAWHWNTLGPCTGCTIYLFLQWNNSVWRRFGRADVGYNYSQIRRFGLFWWKFRRMTVWLFLQSLVM